MLAGKIKRRRPQGECVDAEEVYTGPRHTRGRPKIDWRPGLRFVFGLGTKGGNELRSRRGDCRKKKLHRSKGEGGKKSLSGKIVGGSKSPITVRIDGVSSLDVDWLGKVGSLIGRKRTYLLLGGDPFEGRQPTESRHLNKEGTERAGFISSENLGKVLHE